MEMVFDFSEMEYLARAWELAPETVRQQMLTSVLEADLLVQREVQDRTPVGVGAGGGLRGTISSTEQVLSDNVIGMVGSAAIYAIPVELGTRPHFPPIQPILDWVRARLNVPESEQRGVAHAIVRKIGKVGTKGAYMFEKGFDATEGQVREIMSFGVQRIAQRLGEV